jgi:hypothetical protein
MAILEIELGHLTLPAQCVCCGSALVLKERPEQVRGVDALFRYCDTCARVRSRNRRVKFAGVAVALAAFVLWGFIQQAVFGWTLDTWRDLPRTTGVGALAAVIAFAISQRVGRLRSAKSGHEHCERAVTGKVVKVDDDGIVCRVSFRNETYAASVLAMNPSSRRVN